MVSNTVPPSINWWMDHLCDAHAVPFVSTQGLGLSWAVDHLRAWERSSADVVAVTRRLRPGVKLCCIAGNEVMDELAHKFKHRSSGLPLVRPSE